MPVLQIAGRQVEITHPDKVLFPDSGLTKLDLVEYYRQVAPVMLPHLRGHAVTLNRYPVDIQGTTFVQQVASDYFPEYVKRIPIERREGGVVNHMVVDNAASLVYLANQLGNDGFPDAQCENSRHEPVQRGNSW